MSALVVLRSTDLGVNPGSETEAEITIRNTGNTVEQFTIEVLGTPGEWATVEPPVLSLFPQAEGTARVRFAPPRSAETIPGLTHFAVKVTPSDDPADSVVEEGDILVGAFTDVSAELLPLVSRGRRKARHRIALDNRGNDRVLARITATDPADMLKLVARPDPVFVDPGTAGFTVLRVQARKRFLKGGAKTHPFKVHVEVTDAPPIDLDGQLVQPAILPRGSMLVAALMAAMLLWFLLVKPAVRSAATQAVNDPLAAQKAANEAVKKDVEATKEQLDALAGGSTTTTTTTLPAPAAPTTTTTLAPAAATTTTKPFDHRLAVVVEPGSTGFVTFRIDPNKTLSLTDLVAQNLNESAGEMRIQRQPSGGATPIDLLVARLETFKDQNYQFSTPIVFTENQLVRLFVSCRPNQPACSVGLYMAGKMDTVTPPPPTTTTTTTP